MTRETLAVVFVLSAPWAVVLVVALVRGYRISVHLDRPSGRRGEE